MAIFPQINSNLIITQTPYKSSRSFATVIQDLECGARYTFPRRAAGLTGYPTKALGRFEVNFPLISDAEVSTLEAFFTSMRGRWGRFSFLDPSGNLLQNSQDFGDDSWDTSAGVTVGGAIFDPYNNTLATVLSGNGADSSMKSVIGPEDGGMSGYVVCCSAWVNARDSGDLLNIGVISNSGEIRGTTHELPLERWVRIVHTQVLWNNNPFRFILGGNGSNWQSGKQIYVFGTQVSAMKGPGGYSASPEFYGYHANCRFAVDDFAVQRSGPGENALTLPIEEIHI